MIYHNMSFHKLVMVKQKEEENKKTFYVPIQTSLVSQTSGL